MANQIVSEYIEEQTNLKLNELRDVLRNENWKLNGVVRKAQELSLFNNGEPLMAFLIDQD